MRLHSAQIRGLARLIEPVFNTVEQRRILLEQAFPDDPDLVRSINLGAPTPEHFAQSLLNHLNNNETRLESGELALIQLLETLRDASALDQNGMAAALQPFLARLHLPGLPPPEDDPDATTPNPAVILDDTLPAAAVERTPPPVPTAPAPEPRPARRHRRRAGPVRRFFRGVRKVVRWQIILAVLLIVITVPTVVGVALVTDSVARVQESLNSLERVVTQLSRRSLAELTLADFQRLQFSIREVSRSLSGARQQMAFLQPFSSLNSDLDAGLKAMSAAQSVAQAASNILEGLQPTLFYLVGGADQGTVGTQLSIGGSLVERLQFGRGSFLNANVYLSNAQTVLQQIDLTGVSPSLLLYINTLNRYFGDVQQISEVLVDADQLIARAFALDNAGQNYLILSQNSDELRPSGGYLSTYGWMRVRQGRIIDYGYSPTTSLSPNPPPAALASELDIPSWWIQYDNPVYMAWDGSWYADFPSTARLAAWFYNNGNNPRSPVDGVIGINIVGFEYLLQGLGQVTVPGYGEVVTPQNFRDVVYRIRAGGEGDTPHKRFIAAMYRQIISDWQALPPDRGDDMLNAVLRALREKHIMLYFTESRLNQIVRLLGWSGAQEAPAGQDYLMVADANLGNKSNRSITRDITHDVEILSNGTARSRVSVAYDYSEVLAAQDPAVRPQHYAQIDYFNIMQVYVPRGSTLTRASNLPNEVHTSEINGLTSFASLVQVPFDTSARFQFSYTTPTVVERIGSYQRYRLLLQKQSGMLGEAVNVTITLPPGARIISMTPSPAASYNLGSPILEFRLTLQTDQVIEIIYE
jgi:hypothetical protein